MSDWIAKAKDFLKGHPEQAESGLQKVEELVNDKTGGRYAEQVDKAGDAVRGGLGLPPEAEPASEASVPTPQPEPVPGSTPEPGPARPADPTPFDPGTSPSSVPREPVAPPGPDIPDLPEPTLPDGPGTEQPDLPPPGQPTEPSDRIDAPPPTGSAAPPAGGRITLGDPPA